TKGCLIANFATVPMFVQLLGDPQLIRQAIEFLEKNEVSVVQSGDQV
ncbi:hypothetical protein, partial [Acinetobacter baumannii]